MESCQGSNKRKRDNVPIRIHDDDVRYITSSTFSNPMSVELNAHKVKKDEVSHIFADHDYTWLLLKHDHESRPLWVTKDGHIILEGFSPIAERVIDFLTTISEPVSRTSHIHEYKLTRQSLYAAASVGLETEKIVEMLSRLSKTPVPEDILGLIRDCTLSYGKVKLVLRHNRYFVGSTHPETLRTLLRDPVIRGTRIIGDGNTSNYEVPSIADVSTNGISGAASPDYGNVTLGEGEGLDKVGANIENNNFRSFEIVSSSLEIVKKRCNMLNYPILEEYDFKNDTSNPNLEIDLKPNTIIRPYQERSLSKMFGNSRAKSGIIVLPCGAGKTLVGITAACTIKKSTLVLCTSAVSALQWKQQFLLWSNIKPHQIALFTSNQKEKFLGDAGIVITTFSMVANTRGRSHDSQEMMKFLRSREWGFLLLDEVHVVPAEMFRKVLETVAAHSKLGLTATLVREDEKIDHLSYLIGPRLYEANWMDLASKGHIANVQCSEVWCPMTTAFYRSYLQESSRRRTLLSVMNPNKIQACEYLIRYHEGRGDKIIVFSDNLFALEAYACKLGKPFIHGGTSHCERVQILENFQHNPKINTIFLSKIGDTSIDLPEATCLIQVSSHYGSRRQEAQRLGRILRAKRRNDEGFNAFFYSLVSKDTQEMFYSTKRQQFLIDQGYAFKVITDLDGLSEARDLVYCDPEEQSNLLDTLLKAQEREVGLEENAPPKTDGQIDDITFLGDTDGRSDSSI